jgi:transposase-like protein
LEIEEVREIINMYDKGRDEMVGLSTHGVDPDEKSMSRQEFEEELERILSEDKSIGETKRGFGKLKNVLLKWRRLFSRNNNAPGITTKTKLYVKLRDEKQIPVRERPRRMPLKALEVVREMVKEMEKNGIVEKNEGAWGFPVVLATKPDGSWRFCVDYSKLNQLVVKDVY